MICPKCGSTNDDVYDSRFRKTENYQWRRRQCLDCTHKFTTYEIIEGDSPLSLRVKAERMEKQLRIIRKVLMMGEVDDE